MECFWELDEVDADPTTTPHLVVPDGRPELIVHYRRPFVRRQGGVDVAEGRAFLFGQLLEPIELTPNGPVGVIAARLRPEGLGLFGSQPAFELTGRAIPVSQLGYGGADLSMRVAEARSPEARRRILENFLLRRAGVSGRRRSAVSSAVDRIRRHQGSLPIERAARAVGVGRRQLERLFREQVGVSPKWFSRQVRFQALLRRLPEGLDTSWADLAADLGYYDQAHMLRDFRNLAGRSATAYLTAPHELTTHFACREY